MFYGIYTQIKSWLLFSKTKVTNTNHSETCFGLCLTSMNRDNVGGKGLGYIWKKNSDEYLWGEALCFIWSLGLLEG